MHRRLSVIVVSLLIAAAFVVSGCGDEDSGSTTAAPTQTTAAPTPETSSTGATGDETTSESAKRAFDNCLAAAEQLPDEDAKDKAKKQCQTAYDNIKEATKNIDQSVAEARERCKKAAESIPNEQAKQDALAACERFQ